jgi:hypothetical protein
VQQGGRDHGGPLAIAPPEGCQNNKVAVPKPVVASVQIVDPSFDVGRLEIVGSGVKAKGRSWASRRKARAGWMFRALPPRRKSFCVKDASYLRPSLNGLVSRS